MKRKSVDAASTHGPDRGASWPSLNPFAAKARRPTTRRAAGQAYIRRQAAEPGDDIFTPRGAVHSVMNIHGATMRWLYGHD